MIFGIGTDIVAVARMSQLWNRHGERALERVLAPEEREACRHAPDPGRFLAKRFAAKEALGKALGTGIRAPVLLTAIAVAHDTQGKPFFRLAPELAAYLDRSNLAAHLSISDEREFSVAFAVVEQR
ncbi:MAG: holo-ACP synthase [Gammaproteobacteria bacterium]|nr:holo-ACP synthase [Gammaproteobacteria bacterium]MBU1414816.1 holo-ACP synthase [Gammaproteobacteria bacterium]